MVKASCILHIAKFNCSFCGMTQFKRPDVSVYAPVNMSIDRFLLSFIRSLAINPCIMGVTLFMRYCSMSVSLAGHRGLPIFASVEPFNVGTCSPPPSSLYLPLYARNPQQLCRWVLNHHRPQEPVLQALAG